MVPEESKQQSPQIPKQPNIVSNAHKSPDCTFTPGFRSAAAMAGWDEEALLFASHIVEDTPDRSLKQKKRSNLQLVDTPPSDSRRKRKAQRRSSIGIQIPVLDLDEIENSADSEKKNVEIKVSLDDEKEKKKIDEQCPKSALPCMDRLREELSCAICLEICFEPSSTPCGHSFCKKCLRSAADKCGKKCPKCRQLISNERSCTVNTVLWNTIQLLFPQEVEVRKAALQNVERQNPSRHNNIMNGTVENEQSRRRIASDGRRSQVDEDAALALRLHNNNDSMNNIMNQTVENGQSRRRRASEERRRRRQVNEDAALALRLQRQDFMEAFSSGGDQRRRRV